MMMKQDADKMGGAIESAHPYYDWCTAGRGSLPWPGHVLDSV